MAPNRLDERRIEILADGLPLFHGTQIAVDTTLADVDRAALRLPRGRKSAVIRSCLADTAEHAWWSWELKWGAGGRSQRQGPS